MSKPSPLANISYYVFMFDVTSANGPFVVGVNPIVVPRSIFLDSRPRKDFDGGTFAPLTDATLCGEDLEAASVSESVAGTISKSLSGADAYDVLSRLLRNTTNVPVYSYVDVTSYVLLMNLPADVVRIVPWAKVTNGATGAPPDGMPGFVNVLVQLGQLFYDGLVALGTFIVNLAEAIADWGMKTLGALWNNMVAVAQKAGEVLGQFLSWIQDVATKAFVAVVEGFKSLLNWAMNGFTTAVTGLFQNKGTLTSLLVGIPLVILAIVKVRDVLENLFVGLEAAEAGITTILAILSGGAAAVLKTAISLFTKKALLKALLSAVLVATVMQLGTAVLDVLNEDAFNSTLGSFFKGTAGSLIIGGAIWSVYKDTKKFTLPLTKWASVAASSLLGLFIEVMSGTLTEQVMNALGTTDPFVHGALLAFFDEMAFITSFFGVVKLFQKVAGEDFVKTLRKVFTAITSGLEDALTFTGFIATEAGITSHVVTNEYGFKV